MKIGLLVGREETFPKAFLEAIERLGRDDVTAEMLTLDGTAMDDAWDGVDVIIDRISHDVPYYRLALKQAALAGVRIVNNPFWCTADDKFFGYSLAHKLGLAVPRTMLLPDKDHSEDITSESLRNLAWPIDWNAIADYVGMPAFLKPATGGGWKQVSKVHSVEELIHQYDRSGQTTMVVQESIDFEEYLRCFCFGRKDVVVTRYDVDNRSYLPLGDIDKKLEKRIIKDCLDINIALGYDVNTVEFAVKDGVPYAIDFTNFAPDMEFWSIGPEYFEKVVEAMVNLSVDLGTEGRHDPKTLDVPKLLAGDRKKRRPAAGAAKAQKKTTKKAATKKVTKKTASKKAAKKTSSTSKKTAKKKAPRKTAR